MALPIPKLDDLDFDRLVDEARALIPRYAPEWTDHNLHDPGITLIELIAWIVDQQIFRAGFVSDRHIEAFAALLGVRPNPAVAARGMVWPADDAVDHDPSSAGANLPKGAVVRCVEQPELAFELAAGVYVTPAVLANESSRGSRGAIEINAVTTQSRATRTLANDTGIIELVFDRPLVEQRAGADQNPIAIGIELEPAESGKIEQGAEIGRLVADYRIDRGGAPWRRVDVVEDGTHALNRSGVVSIAIPPAPPRSGESRLRLYTRRRLAASPPKLTAIALNVLPVVQQETRDEQVVGTSTGLPDQSFDIDLDGLTCRNEVRIEVTDGEGRALWAPVGAPRGVGHGVHDLSEAGPDDAVYELSASPGRITFGNGVNGRIPARGAQILASSYTVTRGAEGNMAAGLAWTVVGAPMQVGASAYGTNHAAFSGGKNESTMKQLRAEARRESLQRRALVPNDDLRAAVRTLAGFGVADAEVISNFHPALPGKSLHGVRSVIIKSSGGSSVPRPGYHARAVARALEPRRVLGERLAVIAAEPVAVRIEAKLLIDAAVSASAVVEAAGARLNERLSEANWPVGREVRCEEMKALLAGVDGVVAVLGCRLAKDGGELGEKPIRLRRHQFALGSNHTITTSATMVHED